MDEKVIEAYEIPTLNVESLIILTCPHQAACNGK